MTARPPIDSPADIPVCPAVDPASFADLGVPAVLVDVLARHGVTTPFPIQTRTLPDALAGRDVLGRGRTGSGKTYAFVLPLLIRLAADPKTRQPGQPRALILAPTRELATQIDAALAPLAAALSLRSTTIFGGVSAGRQIAALRHGVDIVVACPGRLDDHMSSRYVDLRAVEITVIDEADHLADLGFLPVVRRLLDQTPKVGQRMLFSATLDSQVDVLVRRYLRSPVTHSVEAPAVAVTDQSHHVLHGRPEDHFAVLVELTGTPGRSIVFTRTKHRAKSLARRLVAAGVPAVELHGNLAQNARDRNLRAFTEGTATTLVATDIAARGIHVDDVRLVIHADPPAEHKAYLHRSGRTARAGNIGTVISLTTDPQLNEVHRLARQAGIEVCTTRVSSGHPLLAELSPGERIVVPATTRPSAGRGSTGRGSTGRGSTGRGSTTAARPAPAPTAAKGSTSAPGTGTANRPQGAGAAAFSARSRAGGGRGR